MKRRDFLKSSALTVGALAAPGLTLAADNDLTSRLTHRVNDASAPEVFFVPQVNSEALIRVYSALKPALKGRVGIKMTFETPGGPHLDPQLVKALADHTKATLIDNNCYPPRDTTTKHLEVARGNGFDETIAPIDILDADGYMDLPVSKGYHLKFARTGSHFANYDTLISMVRFKAHFLDFYGGTLKNLSICMGTGVEGKCLRHKIRAGG